MALNRKLGIFGAGGMKLAGGVRESRNLSASEPRVEATIEGEESGRGVHRRRDVWRTLMKSSLRSDRSSGIFRVTTTTVSHDAILGKRSGQRTSANKRRTLFRRTAWGANLLATTNPKRGRDDEMYFINKKEPFEAFPFLKTLSKSFFFLIRFEAGSATERGLDG